MKHLVDSQRTFFSTHITHDIRFRIRQLKKLENTLRENEEELYKAIFSDFKKSAYETYISELGHLYHEISKACKKLKKWSCIKKVKTNLMNLPSKSYKIPVPFGVVLVIGSWNFPYLLSLVPAVSAIAAGNTVIMKPSELPANTSRIMAKIINENFEPHFFKVIEGGIPETTKILKLKFDKIFFTGSNTVGKIVYQAAAKNLTPVTLELGGKNPAIFTENCNLKTGTKRMIWAKFLNAGQTCVAPDYVLVHKSIKDELLTLAVAEIEKSQYSTDNKNFVQIINEKNTKRLIRFLDHSKIHYGGSYDLDNRHIEPTILTDVHFEDDIMQEEIFGPLLPVLEYDDLNSILEQINARPKPLSCYVFTNDKRLKNKILHELSFGGGAVNDAVMHFINNNLPFGGVGDSGIGSYHGEHGFKTFTHYKGILDKPAWFEPGLKYYPHTQSKLKWIKRIIK